MYGYPHSYSQQSHNRRKGKKTQAKKVRKPKGTVTCLIGHTSLRVPSKEDWYFDSGYSRNMTGEKSCLEELKPYSNSYVNFGNWARGRIKGINKLVSPGFHCLDNLLFVEGLTDNLINISQLCDQGLNVIYNKSECIVSSKY